MLTSLDWVNLWSCPNTFFFSTTVLVGSGSGFRRDSVLIQKIITKHRFYYTLYFHREVLFPHWVELSWVHAFTAHWATTLSMQAYCLSMAGTQIQSLVMQRAVVHVRKLPPVTPELPNSCNVCNFLHEGARVAEVVVRVRVALWLQLQTRRLIKSTHLSGFFLAKNRKPQKFDGMAFTLKTN